MKYLGYIIVIILIGAGGYYLINGGGKSSSKPSPSTSANLSPKEQKMTYAFPGILPDEKIKNKKAVVKTNKGTIEFNLSADKAPKTVSNFVYLAEAGFYNNLTWHRVVPGFVIQGGDPQGTGSGGPGYQFPDETVQGDYKAGTVAMANSGPNTNGSQFFICLDDQPNLPKQYNLFGQVTSGMDIVKKISQGDKIESIKIENQ